MTSTCATSRGARRCSRRRKTTTPRRDRRSSAVHRILRSMTCAARRSFERDRCGWLRARGFKRCRQDQPRSGRLVSQMIGRDHQYPTARCCSRHHVRAGQGRDAPARALRIIRRRGDDHGRQARCAGERVTTSDKRPNGPSARRLCAIWRSAVAVARIANHFTSITIACVASFNLPGGAEPLRRAGRGHTTSYCKRASM